MQSYLEFEKSVAELEGKMEELRHLSDVGDIKIADEVAKLQTRIDRTLRQTYAKLTPWQKVQVARHPDRPHCLDYVNALIDDFTPLAFMGVDAQYFSAVLIPKKPHPDARWIASSMTTVVGAEPEESGRKKLTNVSFRLTSTLKTLEPGTSLKHEYILFAGPKKPALLEAAARLNVAPERCTYVADNPAKDFFAPNALGWRTVRIERSDAVHPSIAPPPGGAANRVITTLAAL